jgi:hypothetical protein
VRRGPVQSRRRIPVRDELPLLALSRGDRVRVQGVRGIEREKLEVTDGANNLLVFGEEESNHTRCGICGSLLFSVVRDGAYVHVAIGSLVDAPSVRPTSHIFVGSKAPWFEITDDLPQFDDYPTQHALTERNPE